MAPGWLWLLRSYTDHGPRDTGSGVSSRTEYIYRLGSRGVQSGACVRRAAGACHVAYGWVYVRVRRAPAGRVWYTYHVYIPGSRGVCSGVCVWHATGSCCGVYAARGRAYARRVSHPSQLEPGDPIWAGPAPRPPARGLAALACCAAAMSSTLASIAWLPSGVSTPFLSDMRPLSAFCEPIG